MKKIINKLNKWLPFQLFKLILLKVKLPFFEKVPLYHILRFFLLELFHSDVSVKASAISFNFLIALFPFVIFLFTLIPYFPIGNFTDQLFELLQEFMPSTAFEAVQTTILDITTNPRSGLLSIGFLLAMYFATNGVHTLMDSFDKADSPYFKKRSFIKQRMFSTFLLLILTVCLILAVFLIIAGGKGIGFLVSKGLNLSDFQIILVNVLRWLILLMLIFFAVSFLYYFGPSTQTRYRFISPGSIIATLLIVFVTKGFSFYINNFNSYNKIYGSIGTIPMLMFLVYLVSIVLLIGFELNASIYIQRGEWLKEKTIKI